MNKKGALTDLFMVLILTFVISIILGLLFFVFSEVETKMLEQAPNLQKNLDSSENITQLVQRTFGAVRVASENLKWISVMLIVGLMLSAIIHSFLVNARPIFWVSYLFIWMLATILAYPIANVYEEIYLNPQLAPAFSGFVGQNYLMLHLPTWIMIIGFISGTVLFLNFVRTRRASFG